MTARDGWSMTALILAGIHQRDNEGFILGLFIVCLILRGLEKK